MAPPWYKLEHLKKVSNKSYGVTLLELLIVLAVIALLSTLAYPRFTSYLIKNQRQVAQQQLYELQIKQEQWRLFHAQYSSDINDLDARLVNDAHYEFSIDHASAHDYQLSATAKQSSRQVQDQELNQACHTLTLTHDQQRLPTPCW
ncbi:type IV pilin protein [Oceanisphaera avium]|uniref:Prepilin-type cleavage/methylation domain-containing protein n=1 Tax=Oceanisphaera avium TaxID=1903694 RepID=A0A1Y0CXN9_9GAMM|nr:type IV pilin protein [Oceanisphaera avium]ART80059.1 hypothetical protein CBP12_07795 [Oceanisphaera avium]